MTAPTTRDSLALIAESLRRMADMMAADREAMEEAERDAASRVAPEECPHPRAYRIEHKQGAQVTLGCQLCGCSDITVYKKAGAL